MLLCWNFAWYSAPFHWTLPHQQHLLQKPRRVLVGVERAAEFDQLRVADFIRAADAKCERSLLVYTHFASFVGSCAGTRELNAWMGKAVGGAPDKTHFVTMGKQEEAGVCVC